MDIIPARTTTHATRDAASAADHDVLHVALLRSWALTNKQTEVGFRLDREACTSFLMSAHLREAGLLTKRTEVLRQRVVRHVRAQRARNCIQVSGAGCDGEVEGHMLRPAHGVVDGLLADVGQPRRACTLQPPPLRRRLAALSAS